MTRTKQEIVRDIERVLDHGASIVPVRVARQATRRARRKPLISRRPSEIKETKVEIPSRTTTLRVRPAKLRPTYNDAGWQTMWAREAQRADGAWLVLNERGRYVGILRSDEGEEEPWSVARLARESLVIGDDGVEVSRSVLTDWTWQAALAKGVRVYWQPDRDER